MLNHIAIISLPYLRHIFFVAAQIWRWEWTNGTFCPLVLYAVGRSNECESECSPITSLIFFSSDFNRTFFNFRIKRSKTTKSWMDTFVNVSVNVHCYLYFCYVQRFTSRLCLTGWLSTLDRRLFKQMAKVVGFACSQNIIVKGIIIYDTITKQSPYAGVLLLAFRCILYRLCGPNPNYRLPHNK